MSSSSIVATIFVCFCSTALQAQISQWQTDGGGEWINPDNWSQGIPDGVGQYAEFFGHPLSDAVIRLPGDRQITLEGINFNRGPISVQLQGDNRIVLNANGETAPSITADGSAALVLDTDVFAEQSWSTDGGGSLVIQGSLGGVRNHAITKTATGTLTLGGDNTTTSGYLNVTEGILATRNQSALGQFRVAIERDAQLVVETPLVATEEVDLLGSLTLNADATLPILRMREDSRVTTVGDAVLTIGELHADRVELDLNLDSIEPLRIARGNLTAIRLGSYDKAIYVDSGHLDVAAGGDSPLGTKAQPTFVSSTNADLAIRGDGVVDEDIHLLNATGYYGAGGLLLRRDAVVAGEIHLGDVGSIIDSEDGHISGSIHGGGMTVIRDELKLTGGGHTFTGETKLQSTKLVLQEAASFQTTSAIQLKTTRLGEGSEAHLVIENGFGINNDRIADSVPIRSNGGKITFAGNDEQTIQEQLGELQLQSGRTQVDLNLKGSSLSVAGISREPHTTLRVRNLRDGGLTAPGTANQNGIIGGWMLGDEGFLVYDEVTGFRSFNNYTSLASADSQANVRIGGAVVGPTSSELAVNSLTMGRGSSLTLGGLLTVSSGGIVLGADSSIQDGTITAGADSNYDLYFHTLEGSATVGASITDNESNPVGVVVDAAIQFTGENTHSGGTYISNTGQLLVTDSGAFPADTLVQMDGGVMLVRMDDDLNLGTLTMSHGARVMDQSNGNSKLNAAQISLKSGLIQVPLTGDGSIEKTGDGVASIMNLSEFAGAIAVNGGSLEAFELSSTATVNVNAGGSFRGEGSDTAKVNLRGGNLAGQRRFNGVVDVQLDSTIQPYMSDGNVVVIRSQLLGDGNLDVSHTVLELNGDSSQFNGEIRVQHGSVEVSHPAGIGPQGIVLEDGGAVFTETELISGSLFLDGGSIEEPHPTTRSTEVTGPIRVLSRGTIMPFRSRRGNSITVQDVTMDAGTQLFLDSDGNHAVPGIANINGDLTVGGDVESPSTIWVETTSNSSGRIVGDGVDSTLVVLGQFRDEFLAGVSFSAAAENSSLSLVDADQTKLALKVNATVQGDGTIKNDLAMQAGSRMSPGDNGVGALEVQGNVAFGAGAILELELLNALGNAGTDWDLLRVAGDADFNDEAVLVLDGLSPDGSASGPVAGFDPNLDFSWTIATAGSFAGDADSLRIDATDFATNNGFVPLRGFRVARTGEALELTYGFTGDANGDNALDIADISSFCAATDSAFDLNEDGNIDSLDLANYVSLVFSTVPGDANLDGDVAFADFLILSENFGTEGIWANGDFDCSGDVSFSDFLSLSSNFGFSSAVQPVPEPRPLGTSTLLLVLIAFLLRRSRDDRH